jgi:hypothetical protein
MSLAPTNPAVAAPNTNIAVRIVNIRLQKSLREIWVLGMSYTGFLARKRWMIVDEVQMG